MGEQRMREHSILTGAQRLRLEDGSELRLLSALEVLEARREGRAMEKSSRVWKSMPSRMASSVA